MMVSRLAVSIVVATSCLALACSDASGGGDDAIDSTIQESSKDAFEIESSAFDDGDAIPDDHTCNGKPFGAGFSPKLKWKNAPSGTQSFAVVFEDRSLTEATPVDNRGYHWVIWDIPKNVDHLNEALPSEEFLSKPKVARQWSRYSPFGYLGPCPNFDPNVPVRTDTYAFVVYALAEPIIALPPVDPLLPNYTRVMSDYLKTIEIGKAELFGTSDAIPSAPPVPPGPPPVPSPRP